MFAITRAAANAAMEMPVVTANTPRGSRIHSTTSDQFQAIATTRTTTPAAPRTTPAASHCTASAARANAAVSNRAPGTAMYRFISAPLEADRFDRTLRQEQREQQQAGEKGDVAQRHDSAGELGVVEEERQEL